MRLRTKFEDDDFKLGEVVVANIVSPFTKDELKICCRTGAGGLHTFIYHSIAEVLEDWEDYEPTEPLIKDEKVKKLLGEVVELELTVNELSKRFDEFNKHYVELCGEEEE